MHRQSSTRGSNTVKKAPAGKAITRRSGSETRSPSGGVGSRGSRAGQGGTPSRKAAGKPGKGER